MAKPNLKSDYQTAQSGNRAPMVMSESLATSTDVSGCEWHKTGIYMEEGPLVKMRLRRPSEPPGNAHGLVGGLSPAGVLTFIHKPDCYSQMHQNSKQ